MNTNGADGGILVNLKRDVAVAGTRALRKVARGEKLSDYDLLALQEIEKKIAIQLQR